MPGEDSVSGVYVSTAESAGAEAHCPHAVSDQLLTTVSVSGEDSVSRVSVSAAESAGAEAHCPHAVSDQLLTTVTVSAEDSVGLCLCCRVSRC